LLQQRSSFEVPLFGFKKNFLPYFSSLFDVMLWATCFAYH